MSRARIGVAPPAAHWVATLVLAALLALLAGCGERADAPASSLAELVAPGALAGHHLLLVTLDTTRPDHLGCYGDARARTPVLDELARRGLRVDGAVTCCPVTLPAHASLLTGLEPPRHGVRDNGRYRLPADGARTLAEELRDAGYATAAILGCFVLDRRFGLDRGFEHYDFRATADGFQPLRPEFNERDAREVTDAALLWLSRRETDRDARPFFLWVHYFDPHLPYRSPLAASPAFRDRPYDAEIAHVDAELGRLLARFAEAGLRDRTVIVVVGDHGESLGEHGEPTHGLFLYDSTVRIPLIFAGAALDGRARRLDDRVVSIVDLRPTLEDLLGLARSEPCDGISLFAPPAADRAVYLETELPLGLAGWSPLFALRTRTEKFVLAPQPESYDLAADAGETRNRWTAGGHPSAGLERMLRDRLASQGEEIRGRRAIDDLEARRLASLGYVLASGDEAAERPDPKAMLPLYNRLLRAETAYTQSRFAEALALANDVLHEAPDHEPAIRLVAFSEHRLGRANQALDLLDRAFNRRPRPYLGRALAQLLILENRLDEARAVLDRYAELAPGDGRVAVLRGDLCVRLGDPAAARRFYRQAIAEDYNLVGPQAELRLRQLATSPRAESP
ncbi:MAG TPA: sulfatase-like hydrolase/transferase [Candidatus Krumholzibacteria bacterium]|nr:sulfatase-like hydrolase/transferase [Candidatus Krumholzibacteria bacterium]HPD72275.1 sulfatase-like hydrolase/transferase [Candidatus Krumholzibacteria bacterium]HRY40793.1 sulfatase-like hydrolase/transferase [Candidatus Krumholzibacteria bacterium]